MKSIPSDLGRAIDGGIDYGFSFPVAQHLGIGDSKWLPTVVNSGVRYFIVEISLPGEMVLNSQ